MFDDPYLVAIIGGKSIEIRTLTPKVQIDSFHLNGVKIISRTRKGHIYAASNNCIWCLKSTPIETQIESLTKHKQFELALSLAVSFKLDIWNSMLKWSLMVEIVNNC